MRRPPGLAVAWLLLSAASLCAQSRASPTGSPRKQAVALRISSSGIRLDGRLDDPAWREARWLSDFTQKMPHEGAPPSDSMRLAVLYDAAAVYVGARMYSRDPSRIQAPLSRRDHTSQAEHLWVSFDSYHDRRTAYSFGVTASGVRMDFYHPRDNEYDLDPGFDPVWEAKAVIDSLGWTAEMRIPFSQLRFTDHPVQVWGFNTDHWNPASSEDVFWIPVPTNQTGWSSWMGELVGIEGIKPPRRLELLPYVATNATVTGNRARADPFDDGRNLEARGGADLKMGLGPNVTLDATVNPDFGQVEADPAVVNLSAFEVFFDERRPFFTEGSQLLRGSAPHYFYSRRIGDPPRGEVSGDFVDYPPSSTILGAAKVTGRLASGLALGALTAVTGRESAQGYDTLSRALGRTDVAPVSGYGVARLQQEFGSSGSVVGATLTAVQRDVPRGSPLAALYNRAAVVAGADWVLRWAQGGYELRGWLGVSHIRGDTAEINRVQMTSVHFLQRPDAPYLRYDPTRTSLTGSDATLQLNKRSGRWLYGVGAGWESPAFEPNDAGRLVNGDGRTGFASLTYRETRPTRAFQNTSIYTETDGEWDFGGTRQFLVTEVGANLTLRNFWTINSYLDLTYPAFDHSATRGGPQMATPRAWNAVVRLGNSFGARTSWNARVYYGRDALAGETYRLSGGLSVRPSTRWQLSVTPNYLRAISPRQYVATLDSGPPATYGGRYVFAFVDQSTFLTQLRANYTLTPDLTIEVYAEPFAASGRYYGFGDLRAAKTLDLVPYSTDTLDNHSVIRRGSDSLTFKDGGYRRAIGNPDFNVLSFRSNVVLRWEWRPGSTLYLVWQQNRFASDTRGVHVGPADLWDTLRASGDNFLAVKVSYWMNY